jgi:DNA (cytosine-5)-methyltransferase 1
MAKEFTSIDLFAGCGGLTLGMEKAGFKTKIAVENNTSAVSAYKLNHKKTKVIQKDIREIDIAVIKKILNGKPLHLLAGCPPCQGFSSIRKLNRKKSAADKRNSLVMEYFRFVKELRPLTIMMENVPGLKDYFLFKNVVKELTKMGYNPKFEVVNVKDYGVPQSRKRLVMVGSLLGEIDIAPETNQKNTVRKAIGKLKPVSRSKDPIHKIHAVHEPRILEMIRLIPKNGGGRRDLPKEYILKCHEGENIGFNDVYGRLRWDDYSTTITGGCLNPSKGRFLHPVYNRSITAREAALLQTFPLSYKFPRNISKSDIALLIGNALPPKFSLIQSKNIKKHLKEYLG